MKLLLFLVSALVVLAAPLTMAQAAQMRRAAPPSLHAQTLPSLEQRRRAARREQIRRAATECRAIADQLKALQSNPCAMGDRLDPKTNICYAPKNVWMPYIRWDPAAGRCKPRDRFNGVSCVSTTRRYHPGKRYAQSLVNSVRMYGHATAQLQEKLSQCRHATNRLKNNASRQRSRNDQNCHLSRQMHRADLVKYYCK